MKTIEIIVSPNGQSRLETKGFSGGQCLEASRFLESTLGRTLSEARTAEFHAADINHPNHLEQET